MNASPGLDKGAADQFESGSIKVKSGVEATAFTETGLRLSDGSEVKGNVIIFAYVLSFFTIGRFLTECSWLQNRLCQHPRS